MNRTSRWRPLFWFAGLASVAGSAGLTWGLCASGQIPLFDGNPWHTEPDTTAPAPGVVCFGHVDVEQGVARLACEQNGRINAVLVEEGQSVAVEAPLLQLDDRLQKARLAQALRGLEADRAKEEQARLAIGLRETDVRLQQAVLDAARDRLNRVERELDRCRNELKEMVSARILDELSDKARDLRLALRVEEDRLKQAESQVEVARHEGQAAAAAVGVSQEQVKQAEKAAADCVLRAPCAGLVLRIRARSGELVGPAFPEPLIEFCPDQPLIVRAEVSQEFAHKVHTGAICEITDDYADAGVRWRGVVARVSGWYAPRRSILFEPLQVNDARTLECLVQLEPGPAGAPRIGQRMRVVISSTQGK